MAISKIQYDTKVAINIDSTIPDINKCNASDLNEIKSVVNNNADEIPTKISDLTNDSGYITKDVNDLTNYTKTSDLSSVATSGSYNDLTDTPTIPSISDSYGTSTTDGYSQNYINTNTLNPSGEPSTSEEDVSSATFNNTLEAPMDISLKGNTLQNGTPTPSSPIPVNNVSGDNDIVVQGKNLINKNNYRLGYYDSNGNWNNANNNATFDFILVKPNTTYTFSTNANTDNKNFVEFGINKNFITRATTSYNTKFKTITTSQNTYYISAMMNINGQAITQSDIDNLLPQLEQNNETTTYEAYNGTTYNIDLPVENLFDEVWENGGVNSTTGANENNGDTARIRTKNYISVKPSTTYTLTFDGTNVSDSGGRLILYDTSKGFINCLWYQASYNGKWTFTTTSSSYYIRFTAKKDSGTWDLTNIKFQLEKGSKSNSYTPYGTTSIELNKIGTYQDYIYKENDKWYLHKEIEKLVLDGANVSSSGIDTTQTNTTRAYLGHYTNAMVSTYRTSGSLSNQLVNKDVWNGDNEGFYFTLSGTWIIVRGNKTQLGTTQQSIMDYFNANPLTLYYPLETPTNTEITYTPLIEQLNTLEQAQSKNGTTNVNQVNNDLPFILDLSVFNDTYNGRYQSVLEMYKRLSNQ